MTLLYDPYNITKKVFVRNASPEEMKAAIELLHLTATALEIREQINNLPLPKRLIHKRKQQVVDKAINNFLYLFERLVQDVAVTPSRYLPEVMQPLHKLGLAGL